MSTLTDLQAIYASDPDALPVAVLGPDGRAVARRARGFLSLATAGETPGGTGGLRVPVRRWTLRTLTGALGEQDPGAPLDQDATLLVGTGPRAQRFRVLACEPADGDGYETLAVLAAETAP